jgi:hypothetical protein
VVTAVAVEKLGFPENWLNTPKREQLQAHRISRAVGSLFKLLREKHLISEKALAARGASSGFPARRAT